MKQIKNTFIGVLLAGAFCFIQPVTVNAQEVIEDFERPQHWSWSPWVGAGSGSPGIKSPTAAHTGSYGVKNPDWHYRTDLTVGNAGDVLSLWGKTKNPGRVYLGFSANSLGAFSLVLAANRDQLIIQRNSGFGFENLAVIPFTYKLNKWYKLEITWISANSIEGKLYDSDGTTVLATIQHTSDEFVPGGIAIRAFNESYIDHIVYETSCSSPVVKTNDLTVELNSDGNASVTTDKINNDSEVSCGIAEITLDKENFNCEDIGENTVTLTITDNSGNTASATATVTVEDNIAPVVVTQDLTVALDANGEATITAESINNGSTDNCAIANYSIDITSFDCSKVGENTVTLTVTDGSDNSASATATVTVEDNSAPVVVTQDLTVALDANGEATITAESVDNGSTDNCDIATYSLDITSFDCSNVGENTVTLTVTDSNGNSASATANVTVTNDEPQITSLQLPDDAQEVNTTVSLTATYTDENLSQAFVTWGDGSETKATFEEGKISAEYAYSEAGIYEVTLTIIDICGLEAQEKYQYVIIYDPNAGFITGAGWFSSAVGAWTGNASSDIKAHVQFNAKYHQNSHVPQGKLNFTLTSGSNKNQSGALFKFKSTSLNWLVVNDHKAYLTGNGEIDNSNDYSFLLSFIDGNKLGGRVDYIRVKITDNSTGNVIYDNYLNAPMPADAVQELDNGSLVIHDNGSSASKNSSRSTSDGEFLSFNFYPNPAVDKLTLDFTNFTSKKAKFTITNSMGKVEASREVNISSKNMVQVNIKNLSKGIYIIHVETDNGNKLYRFYKS